MPVVQVSSGLTREVLAFGQNLMVVKFSFKKGVQVPTHRHIHEQSSYILKGRLKYVIEGKEVILEAGQSLVIPPNAEHSAVALEETVDINSFTPLREDYL